jgi:hypothetical protein
MDDESYWQFMTDIGTARSLAELEQVRDRLIALPQDEETAGLGEMLFMKLSVFAAVEAGQHHADEPQQSAARSHISG